MLTIDEFRPSTTTPYRSAADRNDSYLLLLDPDSGRPVRVPETATRWQRVGDRDLLFVYEVLLLPRHPLLPRLEFWSGSGRQRVAVIGEKFRAGFGVEVVKLFTQEQITEAALEVAA